MNTSRQFPPTTKGNSKFHDLWARIHDGRIVELSLHGRTDRCQTPALTSIAGFWFAVGDQVIIGSDGAFEHR